MYENQYPDVYNHNRENEAYNTELKPSGGRFSDAALQDTYSNVNRNTNTDRNANMTAGANASQSVNAYQAADANISQGMNTNTTVGTNVSQSRDADLDINASTRINTNENTTAGVNPAPASNVNTNQANNYYRSTGTGYGYGTGAWQNTNYGQSAGSYQYGNSYPDDYGTVKREKKKKEKTGGGYFKKALICVSLGFFFGICAGLGFYAIEAATGMLDRNATESEMTISQTLDEGKDINNGEKAEVISDSVTYDMNGSTIEKTQSATTVVSDVSDVVSAVMPAAVSISNTYTETLSYFGQAMTNKAEASGSGIIVGKNDTELLVATNYHVIEDADKLSVQFVDGSEAEASVKGTDSDMDLAVISIPLESISSTALDQIAIATLGDSNTLKIGEPAIAIGNSLGYGQSVTTGVISALNREMELEDGSTGTFIQTDAAINPGNSGGALLNIKGEVIGINSNKIGGSVIEGMGYAIPISAASPIIADLMLKETKNKVAEEERGFLGISGISVTAEVSSVYGMPKGVYIAQVYEGTAAETAGLQKGDIITAFDGENVSSMDELQRLLEYYAKGDTVEMTVMTAGSGGYHERTVSITLGNKVEQ